MSLSLKGKFYRTAIRPTLLYGTECWVNKKQYIQKISVIEIRILKWMYGKIKLDKVRNEDIRRQVGIAAIDNKLRENHLRWFGYIGRRSKVHLLKEWRRLTLHKVKSLRGDQNWRG